MNTFIDKVRDIISAVIGKILLGVFGISFIITLLLSILQGNNVLLSIAKSIVGASFTTIIFYVLYFVLTKVLSDVINEVKNEGNEDIEFDMENSSIGEYDPNSKQEIFEDKEENSPLEIVAGDILNSTQKNNSDSVEDIDNIVTSKEEPPLESSKPDSVPSKNDKESTQGKNSSIDKKDKLSYDNKKDKGSVPSFDTGFIDFNSNNNDIGSIVLANDKSETQKSSSSKTSKASSGDGEGFIDFSKAAKSNPDVMAKAIRSMRSRDGD